VPRGTGDEIEIDDPLPRQPHSPGVASRSQSQPGTTLYSMAMPQEGASATPLLDDWIAEAGEAAVAAEVEGARRRIDDGSLPSFDNPAALLAFVTRGGQQPA
jgi:hypothetical protein